MREEYGVSKIVIVALSVLLSVLGIIVQMDWGKALFPETVKSELTTNILLLCVGICICIGIIILSRTLEYKKILWFISILTAAMIVLAASPMAKYENGARLLHIGPVVVRFVLIVPLAFILTISHIVALYAEHDEYKMFVVVAGATIIYMAISALIDTADPLLYVLPGIAYCAMFRYMRKHKWYWFLPGVFILLFAARIIYVRSLPDTSFLLYRDKVIAGWLYQDSEAYSGPNYLMHSLREMIISGGVLGNKAAMLTNEITYKDGVSVLLVGLCERFGMAGFTIAVVLMLEMCRRIYSIGSKMVQGEDCLQGTICKGVGVYLILSGLWSIISLFYILPMRTMFAFPFLCISGFQPVWFFYLAVALLSKKKAARK